MEFPYPLLVCDIGGTNVRLASVSAPDAAPVLLAKLKTQDFPDFADCVQQTLARTGAPQPRSILACGAGPVAQRRLHLTNAAWTIDGPQIAYRLGLSQGLLLNDFEAQALALPTHRPEWLHGIGAPRPRLPGPQLILGPGTGLGVAALVREADCFLPLASEAGHMDFAPADDAEAALWPHLERFHGRVTAESVLSGPGLLRLHKARCAMAGTLDRGLSGADLVKRGVSDSLSEEAYTIRHFWRLTGRFAGDMALVFLARGGVTLAGGILPRLIPLLDAEEFRLAFEQKAPMDELVRSIGTQVVVAPDAVLVGMAAIAAHPAHYRLNYQDRAWR